MKKLILGALLVLAGCNADGSAPAWLVGENPSATTSGKLKACTFEGAVAKVQDGTAFTQAISATADVIATDCVKKLALQSSGLDTQATSDATNALQTLMNTAKTATTKQ